MQNAPPFRHADAVRGGALLRALAAGCAACLCMTAAVAGPGRDEQDRQGQHAERQLQRPDQARADAARLEQLQRQEQMRAYEEQRRAQMQAQQQQGEGFRRNGRLTPDERRDLRRQINEAGQDIYANTPRR